MPNRNYTSIKIPRTGFDSLRKHLKDYGYSARRRCGFLLDDNPELFPTKGKGIIQGRYACELTRKIQTLEIGETRPHRIFDGLETIPVGLSHIEQTRYKVFPITPGKIGGAQLLRKANKCPRTNI